MCREGGGVQGGRWCVGREVVCREGGGVQGGR